MSLAMVRELRAGAGRGRSRRRDVRVRGAARRRRALLRRRRPEGHGRGARARLQAERRRMPLVEVNAAFGELCVAYAGTPLAVVAVLEGTVMGGGFGLACVADVAHRRRERRLPPARDLARRGAGADRALPRRAPGLFAGQAPGRHRRPPRRRRGAARSAWCTRCTPADALDAALAARAGRHPGVRARRASPRPRR